MLAYVADAMSLVSQSIGRNVAAQLLDQTGRRSGYVSREFDGVDAFQYEVVRFERVVGGEGRQAGDELEN
jgi:hypothetical protein